VIVRTAAADRLTNGAFELALSFHLTAVVRQQCDFPLSTRSRPMGWR
jgi:hypothetical protein